MVSVMVMVKMVVSMTVRVVVVVVIMMVRILLVAPMITLNKRRVALGTCRLRLMYSVVRLEHGVRSQKRTLCYHHH